MELPIEDTGETAEKCPLNGGVCFVEVPKEKKKKSEKKIHKKQILYVHNKV